MTARIEAVFLGLGMKTVIPSFPFHQNVTTAGDRRDFTPLATKLPEEQLANSVKKLIGRKDFLEAVRRARAKKKARLNAKPNEACK